MMVSYFAVRNGKNFEPVEKADFYVAANGNDGWSGNLDSPNFAKTDGPFATIERAQKLFVN
ncbi:MAG: hypothetical protein IPF54_07745 [Draconibacterium sp.]|nr:hypothetical protein [Draconibacterium sp.]